MPKITLESISGGAPRVWDVEQVLISFSAGDLCLSVKRRNNELSQRMATLVIDEDGAPFGWVPEPAFAPPEEVFDTIVITD